MLSLAFQTYGWVAYRQGAAIRFNVAGHDEARMLKTILSDSSAVERQSSKLYVVGSNPTRDYNRASGQGMIGGPPPLTDVF